jgi:hypothetical protein
MSRVYVGGCLITANGPVPCYWNRGSYTLTDLPAGRVSGEVTSIYVSGSTVYTSGYTLAEGETARQPCYWKNKEFHSLSTPDGDESSETFHIEVKSGKAYIAGYVTDSSVVKHAGYWIEGEPGFQYLSVDDDTKDSEARSIRLWGSRVYAGGYIKDGDDNRIPCYWTEEGATKTRTDLISHNLGYSGYIQDIYVRSDLDDELEPYPIVYTAGFMENVEVVDIFFRGVFYTVETDMTFVFSEGDGAADSILGMDVDFADNTVYLAGQSPEGSTGGRACYWIGREPETLPARYNDDSSYYATSVDRVDSNTFVSGYYIRSTGVPGSNVYEPVFWNFKKVYDLPVIATDPGYGGKASDLFVVP